MELCATNQEEMRAQPATDPDEVHITNTLLDSFEEELAEEKIVPAKLLKADLSKCVVNSEGDLLEGFPTTFENEEEGGDVQLVSDKEEEENVKSMLEMFNVLHARKRVKYEALVLNRHSFSRTAANILTLSLLVKDGRAEVKAEDSSYFIVPGNVVSEPSCEDTMSFMHKFSHKDWQRMQRQVKTGEELMISKPLLHQVIIPKGARKNARKRKVFTTSPVIKATTFTTVGEPEKLENDMKKLEDSSEPVPRDDSKAAEINSTPTGNQESNKNTPEDKLLSKPLKPLLTYSRRQKKKNIEVSSLLKRYSRKVLDDGGYGRTKTLLFFEELIKGEKKAGDDSETIFERLARAPRRRRTGCPGATQAQNSGVSSPVTTLQVYSAEDKKLKAENDEEKPIVIAPKRFKKSVFGPRQALIARIKARLKAILKHQPVLPPKK